MKRLPILFSVLALSVSAAEVTGTWKGTAETQNGTIERTFVLKADGDKLTGETMSERMGKSTIMDGKVEGDTITFSINVKFQDNEMKLNYKGKVTGDQIRFSVEVPNGGPSLEYVAKKVS